jgi:hypothetical protein
MAMLHQPPSIYLEKLCRYGRKKTVVLGDLSTDRTESTKLAAEHSGKAVVYRTG